jgi:hypothetical protein
MSGQMENAVSDSSKTPTENAIAQIVKMNPMRVTVTLTLPVPDDSERPVVTLEWSREDKTMPLSELLGRIETYVTEFGVD